MPKVVESALNNIVPAEKEPRSRKEKREIVYKEVCVNGIPIPAERLRITADEMKLALGWQTETDYVTLQMAKYPKAKKELFEFGEHYLLKDANGEKVRCWLNEEYTKDKDKKIVLRGTNRWFREGHHDRIEQDILRGRWRFNGETIIIDETARCVSIQHRGTSLVTAVQKYHKNPEAYPYWSQVMKCEPFIESLVVVGIKSDTETLRTIDNVLTRSLTDIFFTSDLFEGLPPKARQECSVAMNSAVSFVWRRAHIDKCEGGNLLQTHSEALEFSERHPKLVEAVRHVYTENGGSDSKLIYRYGVSVGDLAGLMYLMAACDSDCDRYRLGNPPREKLLDLGHWNKAEEFFVELASGDKEATLIKEVLESMSVEDRHGNKVDAPRFKRLGVLIRAWNHFVKGHKLTAKDLDINDCFERDDNGKWRVVVPLVVGGIDLGDKFIEPEPAEPTEEQVEEAKEEVKNGNSKVAKGKELAAEAEKKQREKAEKAKNARK